MMNVKKLALNNPSPVSLSYMWNFGSILMVNFLVQIISGIFISFHYVASSDTAFDSINFMVLNNSWGWTLRYLHMNGASMFFILVYIHIGRGIYYGSYLNLNLWMSGLVSLLVLFTVAFLGYVLPWGQMSFWGATVITSLITAIPYLGESLTEWIWGGFSASGVTLNRFYSMHFILPFFLLFLIFIHILILHEQGSNNPYMYNSNIDKINFHPYFIYKDIFGFILYSMILLMMFCLMPFYLGDSENFIPANFMSTPPHIKPEWYYLFAYAILRSIPNKLGGVLALFFAILIIIILPFTDNSEFSNLKFYFFTQFYYWMFIMTFFILTWLGGKVVEQPFVNLSVLFSMNYFLFFILYNKMKIYSN